MRVLGNPLGEDHRIISGESGAVTTGLTCLIFKLNKLKELREKLQLNKDSQILLFSTEGDTDPDNYRRIVWDGEYPLVSK